MFIYFKTINFGKSKKKKSDKLKEHVKKNAFLKDASTNTIFFFSNKKKNLKGSTSKKIAY